MLPTLVLAAGLGTRLDPLTRVVAKPAVPLAGRTLIEHILDHLRHHGIRDVVVNLHHRADTITSVLGDGAHLGLNIRYSWEATVLGSAGGPRRALPLLDGETILLVNGDTLADVALAPLLGAHQRSFSDVTLAVVPNPAPDRYNGVVLDEEHSVLGFIPSGQADRSSWHFVGTQIAQADVFSGLADGEPAESIAGVYRDRLGERPGSLHGLPVSSTFVDIGTPRDYLDAALAMAVPSATGTAIERGAEVDASARVTQSVIWAGARVEAKADLERCVVAGNVVVPPGYRARDAVIVPATVLHDGDDVDVTGELATFAL